MTRFALTLAAALMATTALADGHDPRPELTIAMPELNRGSYGGYDASNYASRIVHNLYDNIVKRDWLSKPDGTGIDLVPGLATSWTQISPTEWELKIRQGVKFHNGREMTAEDVAFTLSQERREIRNHSIATPIKGARVVDAETIIVETHAPDAAFLPRLSTRAGKVVPADVYQELGHPAFAGAPIGTGPYYIDEVTPDSLTLLPFDDYWGGKPPLSKITYKAVPETSARIAGLITGEYDIITSIPPAQAELVDREDGFHTQASVLENVQLIMFPNADQDEPTGEVTNNKLIRQALVHATDRQILVDKLWNGLNSVPEGFSFPEYGKYHAPQVPRAYDPEKAKELLAEAGYDGAPLKLAMVGGYYVNMDRAVQVMEQQWSAVGLNVELTIRENWSQMNPRGDWDAFPISANFNFPDPAAPMWAYWGAEGGPHRTARPMWDVPERFLELGQTLERSSDPEARKAAFGEMLEIWEDEVPAMLLYRPVEIYGVRDDIQWQNYGMYWMDFRDYNISFTEN